ncbi:hypothetical protein [Streptomyces hygroscopicus]|uniref:hypothetical protein n=1 Tax=Streptomyces hygroscopicus TaxID=1912 RepID=UPI00223F529A|nr:hypothetical protein [Streptomyces hygroscopicus]
MTDQTPLTDQQLDEIDARAKAATPGPWCTDSWEIYQGTEYEAGAEWIGETCRGRVEGLAQDRADAAFVAAARTDVPQLVAEVRRLRARVAELERPAVEKRRNEIRQSFVVLAAQCEQDRDYEGAFNVECQLREREEQWKAEDAANQPTARSAEPDTLPAWLYQRFMAAGDGWENLDADQRAYWEHQASAVRRAVARNGFKTAEDTAARPAPSA